MNTLTKSQILHQIGQIQVMERGKLSSYVVPQRSAQAGPYYKLQRWEEGKNVTRHVPAEQVPLVQAALEGYAQFTALTEQLAQQVIEETRQQFQAASDGVKKKTRLRTSS
jgi:hypothetical protein